MGNYRDRSKWRFDGTIRAAFLREFIGPPLIGGSIDGNPMLTFVSSNATITPAIILSGDGPCQWEVTEGDGTKYYYTVNSFSHTRTVAENMTVRLLNTMQVAPYVSQIDFNGDGIISNVNTLCLNLFSNIIQLRLYANQIFGNFSDVALAPSLAVVSVRNNLLSGSYNVTLPSSVTSFTTNDNSSTGFPIMPTSSSLQLFVGHNQGAANMTQARIDAFIADVFSKRMGFTYTAPVFNIAGTNSAPSGIYQFTNPPTTGKEMIYWLVNDPLTEGFNKQVWTYTV